MVIVSCLSSGWASARAKRYLQQRVTYRVQESEIERLVVWFPHWKFVIGSELFKLGGVESMRLSRQDIDQWIQLGVFPFCKTGRLNGQVCWWLRLVLEVEVCPLCSFWYYRATKTETVASWCNKFRILSSLVVILYNFSWILITAAVRASRSPSLSHKYVLVVQFNTT